jgi:hypothetical protein
MLFCRHKSNPADKATSTCRQRLIRLPGPWIESWQIVSWKHLTFEFRIETLIKTFRHVRHRELGTLPGATWHSKPASLNPPPEYQILIRELESHGDHMDMRLRDWTEMFGQHHAQQVTIPAAAQSPDVVATITKSRDIEDLWAQSLALRERALEIRAVSMEVRAVARDMRLRREAT